MIQRINNHSILYFTVFYHILCCIIILIQPSTRFLLEVKAIQGLFGDSDWIVFIIVSILTLSQLSRFKSKNPWIMLLILTPQQLLLIITIIGDILYIMNGKFVMIGEDVVMIVIADQLLHILIFLFFSIAIYSEFINSIQTQKLIKIHHTTN